MSDLNPVIDYSSRDYLALRQDLIDSIETFLPEWTSRSPNDFGIVLIELFATIGDRLSYYEDRVANEAYLSTAVQRSSVLAIAAMLDYRPSDPVASVVTVQFTITGAGIVLIPAGTRVSTLAHVGQDPIIFETDVDKSINGSIATTGTVTATQGVTYAGEALGTSSGQPNQIFLLFHSPVIEGSTRVFVDEGAGAVEWTFIAHLLDAGTTDNVFTTFTDDNGILNVRFGDGVNGRVPPLSSAISSTYRVGGGTSTNVGAGTITQLVNSITNVVGVYNAANAQGGADAESLDSIRQNAPRSLRSLNRAVSLDDYIGLALQVARVAKANATSGVYTSITLYIAVAPGGGTAPSSVVSAVQSYLSDKKPPQVTVTIFDATYVPIYVTATVHVKSTYRQAAVGVAVGNALKTMLSFDNATFAQLVSISSIYRTINAVDGVDYVTVSVVSRTSTGLSDVQLATNEIPTTDDAHLSITAVGGIS